MRKYLLASAIALGFATPAAATIDGSPYVGLEGGILFPRSQNVQGEVIFNGTGQTNFTRTDVANYRYKKGLDLDFIGGYDLGMFRIEGELGYKHAKPRRFDPGTFIVSTINTGAGTTITTSDIDFRNSASVYSAMLNGLLDFGGNGSWGGYAGGGIGYARVHQFGDSQGKLAWQLIAGAYAPVSPNVDIGLKYRYFNAKGSNGQRTFAFTAVPGTCGTAACASGTAVFFNDSRFKSHSLLASVVYSFGATAAPPPPPPPPPPAPEAPATQTCPDGSVILATSTCPVPPPPPPPAPVERGERGR